MNETLCPCTDKNCTAAHDIETAEQATYDFWFKGEYSETISGEDTPAAVISTIKELAETPDEYGSWIVKNKATKQKWTADKFFAQHADPVAA